MKQVIHLIIELKEIDLLRNEYDKYYPKFKTHLTFVYPFEVKDQKKLEEHIKDSLKNIKPFEIIFGKFYNSSNYVCLEVKSNECWQIYRALNSGILAGFENKEVSFQPHVTIAVLEDDEKAKSLQEKLNKNPITKKILIDSVTLSTLGSEPGIISNQKIFFLKDDKNRDNLPFRKTCEGYFLTKNNKILARDTGHFIEFPGGGLDENETPEQAILREAHEETGLVLDGDLKEIKVFHYLWDENWAKTEKQKQRYKKFKGEEMHLFSGKVKFLEDAKGDGHEAGWPEPREMDIDEVIKKIESQKPFEGSIKEYRESQLSYLKKLNSPKENMKLVITGPRSVGKTTISQLVAKKLGLNYISSDELGEEATKEQGGLDKAIKSGAIAEMIKNKGYNLILDIFKKDNFVFDLSGGSISSQKFPEASQEVRETAKKHAIIIGLLPFEEHEQSIKHLAEREKNRVHFKEKPHDELLADTEKHFKKFPPLFKDFCNFIVYTENKTPDQVSEEIVKIIKCI